VDRHPACIFFLLKKTPTCRVQLDRFLRAKELHPEHGGRPFSFCTDGSLHLRQCLHPEALRKRLALPAHYYRYFDARKCFRQCYNSGGDERSCNTLADMINCILSSIDLHAEASISTRILGPDSGPEMEVGNGSSFVTHDPCDPSHS